MSRHDVLARRTPPAPEIIGAGKPAPALARRGNPAYRQFSAYIPVELYRTLKVRLAESDMDLSEAVEQAIARWLTGGNQS
jgi:hypothetical protein